MYRIIHRFNAEEAYKQSIDNGYADKCTREELLDRAEEVDVFNDYSVLLFVDWIWSHTTWVCGLPLKVHASKRDALVWIIFNRCIEFVPECPGRKLNWDKLKIV